MLGTPTSILQDALSNRMATIVVALIPKVGKQQHSMASGNLYYLLIII